MASSILFGRRKFVLVCSEGLRLNRFYPAFFFVRVGNSLGIRGSGGGGRDVLLSIVQQNNHRLPIYKIYLNLHLVNKLTHILLKVLELRDFIYKNIFENIVGYRMYDTCQVLCPPPPPDFISAKNTFKKKKLNNDK